MLQCVHAQLACPESAGHVCTGMRFNGMEWNGWDAAERGELRRVYRYFRTLPHRPRSKEEPRG